MRLKAARRVGSNEVLGGIRTRLQKSIDICVLYYHAIDDALC